MSVEIVAQADGTEQVTDVTPVVTPGADQKYGDEFMLKIIDTTEPGNLAPKTFSVYNLGTAQTATTVADALADLINADKELPITAAAAAGVLTLTGDYPEFHFRVAASEHMKGSTIDYKTPNVPGWGTTSHVEALEAECLSWGKGVVNQVWIPRIPESQVDPAKKYDITVVRLKPSFDDKSGKHVHAVDDVTLYIAEDAGGTGGSPVGTAVKAWFDA